MTKSIYKRPHAYVGAVPFDKDYFKRKPIAEKLISYFDQIQDGCVIAIDAPWGEGKTWFAQNFAALLKEREFPTVYIDAFETDYGDDPFLAIVSSLLELRESQNSELNNNTLIQKAKKIGAQLLPIGAKLGIGAFTRWGVGETATKEVGEIINAAIDDADDYLEKIIENRLKQHQEEKNSIEGFRAELAKLAAAKDKPIVIFIDELDRCRPTYAISMIERIKHFFDVEKIIFVLVINQQQLESTIDRTYGLGGHAKSYLSKFIHFVIPMQQPEINFDGNQFDLGIFLNNSFARHGYINDPDVDYFIDGILFFCNMRNICLREMDRLVIYYGLSLGIPRNSWFKAYFVFLKITVPIWYAGIKQNDSGSHQHILDMLKKIGANTKYNSGIQVLIAYHTASIEGIENISAEMMTTLDQGVSFYRRSPLNFMRQIIDAIDVRLE